MRHITTIYTSGAGCYRHLLAVRGFDHPAFNEVKCLFTVMGVQEASVTRLHLLDARNDLHVGAGEIGSLQFLAIRAVLRVRCGNQDAGEQKLKKYFKSSSPIVLRTRLPIVGLVKLQPLILVGIADSRKARFHRPWAPSREIQSTAARSSAPRHAHARKVAQNANRDADRATAELWSKPRVDRRSRPRPSANASTAAMVGLR